MLETVVIVMHLLAALGLVALVLLQQGKGAEAGASFGAGASGTVFGSQGSATFLSRFTAVLAATFFVTSLGLGFFARNKADIIRQIGLPDPAAIEVPSKSTSSDIPVLDAKKSASDVPTSDEANKQ